MQLAALLWDVDGTMVESEDLHLEAFNKAFAEAGVLWRWGRELYRELLRVTGGKERLRHHLEVTGQCPPDGLEVEAFVAAIHERKTSFYNQLLRGGGAVLRPGVRRLLLEARDQGVLLAMATTTSPANVHALLESTLADEAIPWACIAAGDMVQGKKPAPDVYHRVLEELRLPPEACLALEDSANGIQSAKAAGIAVIATRSAYTQGDDLSQALAVLDHLGEPGLPCTLERGLEAPPEFVDLKTLRLWHAMGQ
jgi:HAD superfamily hydrolase (TIGR01509 family)